MVDLNVTLNSNTGHPNGMQMVAVVKGKTRNYFVYSESPQVRTTSLHYCRVVLYFQVHPIQHCTVCMVLYCIHRYGIILYT